MQIAFPGQSIYKTVPAGKSESSRFDVFLSKIDEFFRLTTREKYGLPSVRSAYLRCWSNMFPHAKTLLQCMIDSPCIPKTRIQYCVHPIPDGKQKLNFFEERT